MLKLTQITDINVSIGCGVCGNNKCFCYVLHTKTSRNASFNLFPRAVTLQN